jgi:uncharacterized membrane protein YbhN (UPF0104 family)
MTATGRSRASIRRLWPFLKLLIAVGTLTAIFRLVPLADVLGAIGSAHVGYLLASVPLILVGPYLSAARLKILTDAHGMSLTLPEIAEVNFVTRFYGLAVPGQIATGAIRWLRLTRIEDRKAEILAAIVVSRFLHLAGLCLLGAGFLAVEIAEGGEASVMGLPLIVGILGLAGLGLLLAIPRGRRLAPRPEGRLRRLIAATRSYRDLSRRQLGRAVLLALAENLAATVVIYLLALAVEVSVPFVSLGWIRAAVQLLVFLPISIAGLGVREGGLMLALEPYGVSGANAVALSLLVFAIGLLVGAIGGALELRRHLLPMRGTARKAHAE